MGRVSMRRNMGRVSMRRNKSVRTRVRVRASFFLSLLAFLLLGCSRPDLVNVSVPRLAVSDNPASLTLQQGVERQLHILGFDYTFSLVSTSEGGRVVLRVNAQDFSLGIGEEFSFGDFLVKLKQAGRERATFLITPLEAGSHENSGNRGNHDTA